MVQLTTKDADRIANVLRREMRTTAKLVESLQKMDVDEAIDMMMEQGGAVLGIDPGTINEENREELREFMRDTISGKSDELKEFTDCLMLLTRGSETEEEAPESGTSERNDRPAEGAFVAGLPGGSIGGVK